MPFPPNKTYGVLIATIANIEGTTPLSRSGERHFNLIVADDSSNQYQVNIDTQSDTQPNVRFLSVKNFSLPSIDNGALTSLAPGFHALQTQPGGLALDLVHSPLNGVDTLATSTPQSAEVLDGALRENLHSGSKIFVFGTYYDDTQGNAHTAFLDSPENYRNTHLYGIRRAREQNSPLKGIDDVHLNQGTPSSQSQARDNGTYQDGALFVLNADGSYTGLFFAFAEQSFNTNSNGDAE